jgi:hypothetical protein
MEFHTMLKQATYTGCMIGLLLISSGSLAGVYKWTASDGEVIYSQIPPPYGTSYEYVEDPAVSSKTSSRQNVGDIQKQLGKAKANRDQQILEQKRMAESDQVKQENCTKAKQNLSNLTSRGQVTIKEGDLYRKLDENERQSMIKETQAAIDEFCN